MLNSIRLVTQHASLKVVQSHNIPLETLKYVVSDALGHLRISDNKSSKMMIYKMHVYPRGGGGALDFQLVGVCRWGVENRTLS